MNVTVSNLLAYPTPDDDVCDYFHSRGPETYDEMKRRYLLFFSCLFESTRMWIENYLQSNEHDYLKLTQYWYATLGSGYRKELYNKSVNEAVSVANID